MKKTNKSINYKIRYNIITVLTYFIGIILIFQLFNLQIIHGNEYLETSNTRLTRESVLKAARGNIRDNAGTILVGTDTSYNLEIYKTKINNNTLNETLLRVAKVLEENNSKYIDQFPIKINPFSFTQNSEESQKKWKKANKLDENISAEEAFYKFKEKYKIENDDIEETRKIITIRYQISRRRIQCNKISHNSTKH